MSARYPNVPDAPGVPPVLRDTDELGSFQADASAPVDTPAPSPSDWGVFDRSGAKLLEPDSMVATEYTAEERISDYPVENGGFQSYNKVAVPFQKRLVMTKGGTVAEREAFLQQVETLLTSTKLVDVVTPERVYTGVNLTRVRMARSADQGATLLTVEVGLEEIRQSVTVTYSTATPGDSTEDTTSAVPAKPDTSTPLKDSKGNKVTSTQSWATGLPQQPSARRTVNQGAVQATKVDLRSAIDQSTAKLFTSPSGKKLYVYDGPIQ